MTKYNLCVIVPAYNVEKYLDDCLTSIDIAIRQLEYPNLVEVLIVNDGSTDRTKEIAEQWVKKDVPYEMTLLSKKNGGLSSARNTGIYDAIFEDCEYISFVDSDDTVEPLFFKTLMVMLDTCENVNISMCGVNEFKDGETQQLKEAMPQETVSLFDLNEKPLGFETYEDLIRNITKGDKKSRDYTVVWNKMYRSCLFDDMPYNNGLSFKEGVYHEDEWFWGCKAMIRNNPAICVVDTPLYNYRIRENSIMTDSSLKEKKDVDCINAWINRCKNLSNKYPDIALMSLKNTYVKAKKENLDFKERISEVSRLLPMKQRLNFYTWVLLKCYKHNERSIKDTWERKENK